MTRRPSAGREPAPHEEWDLTDEESCVTEGPLDDGLREAVRELRRPVGVDAALDGRIMAVVAAGPRPVRGGGTAVEDPAPVRAWRWLRRPRTVRVSPLGGIAALASLAAAATFLLAVRGPAAGGAAADVPLVAGVPVAEVAAVAGVAPDSAAVGEAAQVVRFVLVAPDAQRVALVGDFNDWQVGATPLRPAASGRMWTVDVPLVPGRHRYAFVVDGESWMPDPTAPRAPGADFGTPSSVVTVAERRS